MPGVRPLLCEAVRAEEVSVKKAEAVLPVAVGGSEAEWVARARRESVRALHELARGPVGAAAAEEDDAWDRMTLEIAAEGRAVVDEAMELAGSWLERETERWSHLHRAEPVPAPEAGVDDAERARRIDARLRLGARAGRAALGAGGGGLRASRRAGTNQARTRNSETASDQISVCRGEGLGAASPPSQRRAGAESASVRRVSATPATRSTT